MLKRLSMSLMVIAMATGCASPKKHSTKPSAAKSCCAEMGAEAKQKNEQTHDGHKKAGKCKDC